MFDHLNILILHIWGQSNPSCARAEICSGSTLSSEHQDWFMTITATDNDDNHSCCWPTSFSVCRLITAVKSLFSPSTFACVDFTACWKFSSQPNKTSCSSIHYSEILWEPTSRDVSALWTAPLFTDLWKHFTIHEQRIYCLSDLSVNQRLKLF